MSKDNIINLNQARKSKSYLKRRAQANENAIKFGRTKAQKRIEDLDAARAAAALEGKKRQDDE
ncbi:DUF4169 family protein [Celeribacter marinus]|uniref:DUF4169 family protein n=1 Tax=Celeribacter marinus TaxID=1397108 RepID=UPI00317F9D8E